MSLSLKFVKLDEEGSPVGDIVVEGAEIVVVAEEGSKLVNAEGAGSHVAPGGQLALVTSLWDADCRC